MKSSNLSRDLGGHVHAKERPRKTQTSHPIDSEALCKWEVKAKTQLSTTKALKVTPTCINRPLAKARKLTGLDKEISDLDFTE